MNSMTTVESATLFECTRRALLHQEGISPEKATELFYTQMHALDNSGDPVELLRQAQETLSQAVGTDALFGKSLCSWLGEPAACIYLGISGRDAMCKQCFAARLWQPRNSSFALCIVKAKKTWNLEIVREKSFFWKHKSRQWYKSATLETVDSIFWKEYRKVLRQLGTQVGLYQLFTAARFWAFYD